MPTQTIIADAEQQMKRTMEKLQSDFAKVRTGRASPALLEAVRVIYYGSPVPVQQVGSVAVTDARTIEIRPWDMSVLPELEKAIVNANLGLTPHSDGKVMRLSFPPPNEDRRKELVKVVRKLAEDFRVSLRNVRRDAIEKVKAEEKNKVISADVKEQSEDRVQGLTNTFIKKVDDLLAVKEKEILEI
ncbi:MAG: ribosome recycling factor [Elusimicrobia bacterium]|nr:ribosome recycling factor [Candidatus Obscuribacterium magneticum]